MNTTSKHYTLLDIMNHVPSREVLNEIERTWQLSRHNIGVYRYRMDHGGVELCIYELTHDGNDPRDNDRVHAWLVDMKQKFNNPAYAQATEQINKARLSRDRNINNKTTKL